MRSKIARVLAAVILSLGLGLGLSTAIAAPAARADIGGTILGPCNRMQAGTYLWIGNRIYRCNYVLGFGGYYWIYVGTAGGHCSPARLTAAC